jgi:hypothetical protein
MKIRNGDTPIQLPDLVRNGDPITAKWANSIRTAIQRIRDRVPVASGKPRFQNLHPFKIITRRIQTNDDPVEFELRLYINYGQVFEAYFKKILNVEDFRGESGSGIIQIDGLLNDPSGSVATYETLSASTTYGVWLKGVYTSGSTITDTYPVTYLNRGYMTTDIFQLIYTETVVDSTHNTPDNKPDEDYVWLFIGSVEVDGNLNPTVTQWWKSDIICGSFSMPRIEPSADSGNSLYISSTDGKPYVPPIVSGDANNDITTGGDGGAYYNDPDY